MGLLFCLQAVPDAAQTASQPAKTSSRPAGSANFTAQLQTIVQNRPELLAELKTLLAQRMHEQGSAIDEQSITDEMLYGQLQSDKEFRDQSLRWMVDHNDISQEDATAIMEAGAPGSAETQPYGATTGGSQTYPSGSTVPRGTAGAPAGTVAGSAAGTTSGPANVSPASQPGVTVSRSNPYPNLPSAADLYRQNNTQGGTLQRFGSNIFRPDVVGLKEFPLDLPAGPDYVLGPGDNLAVDIWGGVSQRITRVVDREGRISLPEAGPLTVAGMTMASAEKRIQSMLEPQYRDAKVDLSVTRLRTVRVYVVGDVQRPGAYDISSLSTPLNALYVAGGPTTSGSMRIIKHFRGSQLVSEQDLYDLLLHGVRKAIEHLEPGDTILVPPIGPQVAVSGSVRRPAIYELKNKTDQLSDVIDMAGGVTVSASLGEIKVERVEAHDQRVTLKVKGPEKTVQNGPAEVWGEFPVQDGDKVYVSAINPYSNQTVYLEGHVYRPGSYPFTPGMKISDLVHSYQDVMPEPAGHAEIVRLQPPDFRPVTLTFDLTGALAGDESVTLQQFDTVRIFGRYEIDAPRVTIYGDVLRPGSYPMSNGMTAAGLVKMAGGFKRSAYKDTADLTSYTVQNGEKVQTDQKVIRIGAAFSGDEKEDMVLKPGDILTILQIPGWTDIGASATVQGEVVYPGSYGINEGEKLSSLLKRAGGLRAGAYPAGALMERVEVRTIAEKGRQQLIRQIESSSASVTFAPNTTGKDQADILQAVQQQQAQTVARLRAQPVTGRMVITISSDIASWENTPVDVELRPGDVINIPRKPSFVVMYGQVYNPSAVTFVPGKTAGWYLRQAGGASQMAYKKGIYVVRANGSVITGQGSGWFKGDVLDAKLQPGDVLVVPEKAVGGSSPSWQVALQAASVIASLAIAAAVVAKL